MTQLMTQPRPVEPPRTAAEEIEVWAFGKVAHGEIPTQEALDGIASALHAIGEFLIEPIAATLARISTASESREWPGGRGPFPEDQRPITYEQVGRLICWTDTLRHELDFLRHDITTLVVLCHEDMADLAAGYTTDGTARHGEQRVEVAKFHGLAGS